MDYRKFSISVSGAPSFSNFFTSLPENDKIRKKLDKMLDDLKVRPDVGEQIHRNLWPEEYKKGGFRNLFRYEVDDAMRAIYTISLAGDLRIEVAVIEFFRTHKEYERRFNY